MSGDPTKSGPSAPRSPSTIAVSAHSVQPYITPAARGMARSSTTASLSASQPARPLPSSQSSLEIVRPNRHSMQGASAPTPLMRSNTTNRSERRRNSFTTPQTQENRRIAYNDSDSSDSPRNRRLKQDDVLEAKVVILGSSGVGKTCIVRRYIEDTFSPTPQTTIGASFLHKKLIVDGTKMHIQFWDTGGEERFRCLAPMYYRGAHAAIIVYDITNAESLDDIKTWFDELNRNMPDDLLIHVAGSKADLEQQREVTIQQARQFVHSYTPQLAPTPVSTPSYQTDASAHLAAFARTSSDDSPKRPSMPPSSSRMSLNILGRGRKTAAKEAESEEARRARVRWQNIQVTEVSAKDDYGIEDIFMMITQHLLARKLDIDRERTLRSKNSIFLHAPPPDPAPQAETGYACC